MKERDSSNTALKSTLDLVSRIADKAEDMLQDLPKDPRGLLKEAVKVNRLHSQLMDARQELTALYRQLQKEGYGNDKINECKAAKDGNDFEFVSMM